MPEAPSVIPTIPVELPLESPVSELAHKRRELLTRLAIAKIDEILVSKREFTVAMLKPHVAYATQSAISLSGRFTQDEEGVRSILRLLKTNHFDILLTVSLVLTPSQAADFYAEHASKLKSLGLWTIHQAMMTSGPVVFLVLTGPGVLHNWRAAIGPTHPVIARDNPATVTSLRATFGGDFISRNIFHGSDSPQNAIREIQLLKQFLQPSIDRHH